MERWVMVMQRKTPQSYAFACFGDVSGPIVVQVSHDQMGWWYVVNSSATSILSARVYLAVFLDGVGLELCMFIVCAVKSKTTDHQCSVPLGLRGKMSRSNSVRGMFDRAERFMTESRSCGPYAVGKNFSVILVETMCIRVHVGSCDMSPAAIVFVCSFRIARYVSTMLVSKY